MLTTPIYMIFFLNPGIVIAKINLCFSDLRKWMIKINELVGLGNDDVDIFFSKLYQQLWRHLITQDIQIYHYFPGNIARYQLPWCCIKQLMNQI